jgi:protein SCO1/2
LWWGLLVVVTGAALAAPFFASFGGDRKSSELRRLGQVPAFEFRSEDGAAFSSASLAGQVWVADFFFTRCSQACPLMTSRMREVEAAIVSDPTLLARARIVSFSLDPTHDTPEVLSEYARHNGVDPRCWRLLTGAPDAIRELCESGFHLIAGGASSTDMPGDAETRVMHSDRFALVDGKGQIRGMYRPTAEPDDMDRLLRDLRSLVAAE